MNRIITYILIVASFVLSSCSQLIYAPASLDADGMYATHNRDDITKNKAERLELMSQSPKVEYVELIEPYQVYRYDWWGYRPIYPRSLRHRSYSFIYGYPYYTPFGGAIYMWDDPYYSNWWGWGTPYYMSYYDPFYSFAGYYSSPFWYSSCHYHHWLHHGHSHAPRPGIVGGSSHKRTIVKKASSTVSPSTKSQTVRNADGSTVGRSSSSSYNRGSTTTRSSSYYSQPSSSSGSSSGGSSSSYRSPSSSGSSSVKTNSIGR